MREHTHTRIVKTTGMLLRSKFANSWITQIAVCFFDHALLRTLTVLGNSYGRAENPRSTNTVRARVNRVHSPPPHRQTHRRDERRSITKTNSRGGTNNLRVLVCIIVLYFGNATKITPSLHSTYVKRENVTTIRTQTSEQ